MNSFFNFVGEGKQVYTLNRDTLREINHFIENNCTVKQIIELLERFLFNDIDIVGSTPVFLNYVKEYFVPFFRSVLKQVLHAGWSAVMIRKSIDPRTKEKIVIPETIDFDLLSPQITLDKKKITYDMNCFDYNGQTPLKNVTFLFMDDIKSIANETLTNSKFKGVMADYRYIIQAKQFAMQSEFVRTNPTIYLAQEKQNSAPVNSVRAAGAFGDGLSRATAIDLTKPLTFARGGALKPKNKQDLFEKASDSLKHNFDYHHNQMNDNLQHAAYGRYNAAGSFKAQYHDNTYIIPPGMELAATPQLPQTTINIFELENRLKTKLFQIFGMSEGLITGTKKITANIQMANPTIKNTVSLFDIISFEAILDRYRDFFAMSFIILYEKMFEKRIKKEAIKFRAPDLYQSFVDQLMADNMKLDVPTHKKAKKSIEKKTSETEQNAIEKSETEKNAIEKSGTEKNAIEKSETNKIKR